MLLEKLAEYSDRLGTNPPPNYKKGNINWFIDLDHDGNLIGKGFIATGNGVGKKNKGIEHFIPNAGIKTSSIKPNLLVDNAEYVLGIDRDAPDPKTALRHKQFVELVNDCADTTANPLVIAVKKFLNKLEPNKLELPKDINYNQIVCFRVDEKIPSDQADVQLYWAKRQLGDKQNLVECNICGRLCKPVSPHPINIKGLGMIGGQTSGMAIISANSEAFESYGLTNSLIAPTCNTCAEKYANAANELIKAQDSHIVVNPVIYLFWTRNDHNISSLSLINTPNPDPEQVKRLIQSAQRGISYDAMDDEDFFATAWSASGARIAVRDWIVTTVGDVRRNVSRWFNMQRLIADDGPHYYGLWTLSASLYKDPNKQMVANVPDVLMRAALEGIKLPPWLLYQAVQRNKADRQVTRARLALIKMVILSEINYKDGDYLVELDNDNMEPAYLCGRLLAELESIQKAAINANTTIVDRFYGSASTAPASVFGTLLRGAQSHLAKLRKEKPGLAVVFQKRLEEIQSGLNGFPRILSLEEQGLFALGYYHQKANDHSKKADSVKNAQEE